MPVIAIKGKEIELADILDVEWDYEDPAHGYERVVTLESDDKTSWLNGGSDAFLLTTTEDVYNLHKSQLDPEILELLTQVILPW